MLQKSGVPAGHMHTPLVHDWPPTQIIEPVVAPLLHMPQLLSSVCVFVHTGGVSIVHAVFGELHVELHVPELHVCSAPHALVHEPQWLVSVFSLTHAPPQLLSPDGQQMPPVLTWPAGQQMPLS
jgi:hypothetical protein